VSTKQECRSSLLSGRNVRWPRRRLPLVSNGEYADGTNRQTDGHTYGRTEVRPLRYAFCFGRGQRNHRLSAVITKTNLWSCLRVRTIRLRMLPAMPKRQTPGSATLLRNEKNAGSVSVKMRGRLAAAFSSATRTADVMLSTYSAHDDQFIVVVVVVVCNHVSLRMSSTDA